MTNAAQKDYYGIYKSPEEAVWRVTREFDVHALPVSVTRVARSMSTAVIPYSDRLPPPMQGISGHAESVCGKWYVFYDPTGVASGHARIAIAHELGHILMGHRMKHGMFLNLPEEETEAERFAERLVAPACVLWALGLKTPEAISDAAGIAYCEAVDRAGRVREIQSRNKYLSDECEQRVFVQFLPYIIGEYKKRGKGMPEYIAEHMLMSGVSKDLPKGI